ncbi:DNA primase [candidate division KSB1 bacterium]|nr:DNA primase [candidate division KSB1 bacterium]
MPGKISPEKIEDVRLASDIVDIISGYLSLQKKGKNYFGLCPFHKEKTPSFSVNPEQQIFHCFGCGAGGNVFTFIMRMEGLTFPESVRLLAKQAGIILPEEDQDVEQYREKEALFYVNNMAAGFYLDYLLKSPKAQKARDYLEKRGIEQEQFKTFSIGFAPDGWDSLLKYAEKNSIKPQVLERAGLVIKKNDGGFYDRFRGRITFAIHNISGQVVGFGARRIINDNSPKYINSPETDIYQKRYVLYGLFHARENIRKENKVVIVEGYTDYISLYRRGVQNVAATSGTSLTEDHARLLRRYTANAVILYDNDSAGAAAALRGAEILLENGLDVNICTLPQGQDPDEFARKNSETGIKNLLSGSISFLEFQLNKLNISKKIGSAAQQAEATRELLAVFAKINDPLKQSYMVASLADKLHIQEAILWEEIKKFERQNIRFKSGSEEKKQSNLFFTTKKGVAELGLLTSIFVNPDLIPKIVQNLDLNLISHTDIREFFQHLIQNNVDPVLFNPAKLLGTIQDPFITRSVSQLLSDQNSQQLYHSWKYAYECLISLQLSVVDDEIHHLRENIQNNQKNAREILEKIKNLKEHKKQIAAGHYIEQ